ncbi:hypothetical protein AK812_SmicGene39847 [Symbiodinium microadriaticum]|uniref:Uncharacterized protein n=1 Tax=Symbiodinium microadriaticum TaxID=2951 RepID=A0A1Q9CA59_SYMMI|nr:hypothetical protein AK812_SmicGene39847 [Symbiodinium microadriaticum]
MVMAKPQWLLASFAFVFWQTAVAASCVFEVLDSRWRHSPVAVPSDWSDAHLVVMRKPAKTGKEPGHYRPIGLQDQLGKLTFKTVVEPFRPLIYGLTMQYPPYAYTPGCSHRDALRRVFDHCYEVRSHCQAQHCTLHDKFAGGCDQNTGWWDTSDPRSGWGLRRHAMPWSLVFWAEMFHMYGVRRAVGRAWDNIEPECRDKLEKNRTAAAMRCLEGHFWEAREPGKRAGDFYTTLRKLRHDAEMFTWLEQEGKVKTEVKKLYRGVFHSARAQHLENPDKVFELAFQEQTADRQLWQKANNKAVYWDPAGKEVPKRTLRAKPAELKSLEEQWEDYMKGKQAETEERENTPPAADGSQMWRGFLFLQGGGLVSARREVDREAAREGVEPGTAADSEASTVMVGAACEACRAWERDTLDPITLAEIDAYAEQLRLEYQEYEAASFLDDGGHDGDVSQKGDRDSFAASGHAVAEKLLTERSLKQLKRFLQASTFYFYPRGGFHLLALLEDGLASPLLAQVVDGLRNALPNVVGQHPLTGIKAWKADNSALPRSEAERPELAEGAHDAAVSVLVWVVPASALDGSAADALHLYPRGNGTENQKREPLARIKYAANRAVFWGQDMEERVLRAWLGEQADLIRTSSEQGMGKLQGAWMEHFEQLGGNLVALNLGVQQLSDRCCYERRQLMDERHTTETATAIKVIGISAMKWKCENELQQLAERHGSETASAKMRVALGTGLVLAGGSGTDTQGTDMASSPDGGGLVQLKMPTRPRDIVGMAIATGAVGGSLLENGLPGKRYPPPLFLRLDLGCLRSVAMTSASSPRAVPKASPARTPPTPPRCRVKTPREMIAQSRHVQHPEAPLKSGPG